MAGRTRPVLRPWIRSAEDRGERRYEKGNSTTSIVFFHVNFIHIHHADEHVLCPIVFDLAVPQSLGTKQ